MLDTLTWTTIYDMSLLIHGTDDLHKMENFFLEALRNLIPFDKALFLLYNEDENQDLEILDAVTIHMNDEYIQYYKDSINSNGFFRRVLSLRKTVAYRSCDLVTPDDETTTMVSEARKSFLVPNEVAYYSGIVITHDRKLLGEIVLYRHKNQKDFSPTEVEILDILKDSLQIRLRHELGNTKGTVSPKEFDFSKLGLTPREIEITKLILRHQSTNDISKALVISPSTTKKHLQNIFSKLGLRSRLQLIEYVHDQLK